MLSTQVILDSLVYPELRRAGPLHDSARGPARITYSFHDSGTAALALHESSVTGWTAWSATERSFVRAALDELEQHINVDFVERGRDRPADIPLGLAAGYAVPDQAGQTYYSFVYKRGELSEMDVSISVLKGTDSSTFYHELGHALGLKHSFDGPTPLPEAYDETGFTVMSYNHGDSRLLLDPGPGTGDWRHFDIAALRTIWGSAEIEAPVLADFGAEAGGWSGQDRFPRLMGDVDGDGRDDIVGFGARRSFTALADGDGGFDATFGGIANFAAAQGWNSGNAFPRLLADVNGDGRDDIVGFGARTTFTALADGAGGFGQFRSAIANFAGDQGWVSDNRFPRVAGDVNGDGIDDIIGFGNTATYTALGRGDGSFGAFQVAIENFSRAQGWSNDDTFPRLTGDINGDGFADIIGFGNTATYTALSRGDGTFFGFGEAIDDFGRAQGWGDNDRTPRLVGDLDGNGYDDILGLGPDIAWAALSSEAGPFRKVEVLTTGFTAAAGWDDFNRLPRHLADIDGDGRDDLVGFSEDGVVTQLTELQADEAALDPVDWFDFG